MSEKAEKKQIVVQDSQYVAIADRGGVAIVAEHLTLGIRSLPYDYAARIQNFLNAYLGTPQQPVPFGGRGQALGELDAWLDGGHAPPYLLLAAPAGRGKSALLVRWSQRLLEREDLALVFVPVSIRFRTNLSSVVFAALTARLAALHGDKLPGSADNSVEVWRGVVADYLARPLPDGRRLLVILDGVDEAADWGAGPDLFPLSPPQGVRVVVSARYLVNDVDERGWLRRLGWQQTGLARTIPLPPLTRTDVKEVLRAMAAPLVTRADVIEELFRLSGGDPLLVRLYVDALSPYGERAASLRPQDLPAIKDGLTGYFERWWGDQRQLWGEAAPPREREVQLVLNLLACALGPLSRDDLLNLAPADANLSSWNLERVQEAFSRLVIGDGNEQGYVFSHPRLGHYFYERLTSGERRAWEQRFLDYGRDALDRLNKGTLAADAAPAYVMEHYRSHLQRSQAPFEEACALMSEGWLRARQALRSTRTAFLDDVNYVWRLAETEDNLPGQIKCVLCHASLTVMSANASPTLLALALEHEMMTPLQALRTVRAIPIDKERHEALSAIIDHIPAPLLAREFTPEEITASRRRDSIYELVIRDPPFEWQEDTRIAPRACGLAGIDNLISLDSLPRVLDVVLAVEDRFEFFFLMDLAQFLTPPELASKAFLAAGSRSVSSSIPFRTKQLRDRREEILARLATYIPSESLPELLRQVISTTNAIGDDWQRAVLLTNVARYLPSEAHERASFEALAILNQIEHNQDDATSRALAFTYLVPNLARKLQGHAFAQALHALWCMPLENYDEYDRLLIRLVSRLRPRFLSKAVATAQKGWRPFRIFLRLCRLFARRRLVRVQLIRDPPWREYVWSRIGHRHPGQTLESMSDAELLAAALATADSGVPGNAVQDIVEKARILDDLAFDMPDDLLLEALAIAVDICGYRGRLLIEEARVWALTTLGARLTKLAQSQPDLVHAQGKEMLRFLSTLPRPELLMVLNTLVDFYLTAVEEKKREAVADGISCAVREVCRWWP